MQRRTAVRLYWKNIWKNFTPEQNEIINTLFNYGPFGLTRKSRKFRLQKTPRLRRQMPPLHPHPPIPFQQRNLQIHPRSSGMLFIELFTVT